MIIYYVRKSDLKPDNFIFNCIHLLNDCINEAKAYRKQCVYVCVCVHVYTCASFMKMSRQFHFNSGFIKIKWAKLKSNIQTSHFCRSCVSTWNSSSKAWICHCFTAVCFVIIWCSIFYVFLKMNRHLFSVLAQSRTTCWSWTLIFLTFFFFLLILTVKNVRGFLLMQRFPSYIVPLWGLLWKIGLLNDTLNDMDYLMMFFLPF